MIYLITPVTWDLMPDGGIRYYSNGGDITDEYREKQDRIRNMLGSSYRTLMDTLKQQIKGFDLDCSHWGEEQNIQLEIQGNEVLALFNLWEYAAEEYPNCRIGDTIGKWTCREVIEQEGGYGKKYLVLFTKALATN
jgi:hypothetical protein